MNNNLPKWIKTNERYSHKTIVVDRLIMCMLYDMKLPKAGW
jgi:hypothetical protein